MKRRGFIGAVLAAVGLGSKLVEADEPESQYETRTMFAGPPFLLYPTDRKIFNRTQGFVDRYGHVWHYLEDK